MLGRGLVNWKGSSQMKVDLGDWITVKNVYGETVTGEIEKIYKNIRLFS